MTLADSDLDNCAAALETSIALAEDAIKDGEKRKGMPLQFFEQVKRNYQGTLERVRDEVKVRELTRMRSALCRTRSALCMLNNRRTDNGMAG